MKTKSLLLVLSLTFAALAATQTSAPAQSAATPAPPPSGPPKYSAADLEKLAAPIALHPDPLIAIILPASVYPLEIVQAARFVQDTNNLPKVDEQAWDDNVKAVAKFPALIQKMNDDLTWTMDLGQAFLDQQPELMDTIQRLRSKASSAGVLKTTPQQVIYVTNTITERTIDKEVLYVTNTVVQIQPSNPQVVYVPTYPPSIYYPPPAYVGPPPVLTFAAGIALGAVIANNCDWHGGGIYVGHHGVAVVGGGHYGGVAVVGGGYHGGGVAVVGGGGHHGDVDIDINRNVNINNSTINKVNRPQPKTAATAQKWQPDQSRMRTSGAPGAKASTQSAQARGWSPSAARTTPSPSVSRPSASPSVARPSPSSSVSRPSPSASRESAFGGMSSGASSRSFSSRGSSSRSFGGGGGGRSFGGRGR